MKILIIGGTKFLGRHLIDAALKNDHEVTLFNRGTKYTDDALGNVEQIHGDRNADLEKGISAEREAGLLEKWHARQ